MAVQAPEAAEKAAVEHLGTDHFAVSVDGFRIEATNTHRIANGIKATVKIVDLARRKTVALDTLNLARAEARRSLLAPFPLDDECLRWLHLAADQGLPAGETESDDRPRTLPQGRNVADLFADPEPWFEDVDLAGLLTEIRTVIKRFVVLPEESADAVALWIAMTYCMDAWDTAPMLVITGPTKQCGKTRLLEIVGGQVYRPLPSSSVTPAALFRVIEQYTPTFLLDEADNALNDSKNELYGLLNASHRRWTASTLRTVGDQHEVASFSTWCAKAFCLIGQLRDTTMDRSLHIQMRRRTPGERVEPKREKAFTALCLPIRRRLITWSRSVRDELRDLEGTFPDGLRDRARDNWEPLMVIAHLAGEAWLSRAHRAALALSGGEESNEDTPAVQLLADCRDVLSGETGDAIASKRLVELLNSLEDRPYRERNRGMGISQAWLAKQLKPFGIRAAGTLRFGAKTAKGYTRRDFEDAWTRYLSSETDSDSERF